MTSKSLGKKNESTSEWSADKRYSYFVEEVSRRKEVWSLRSEEGWVVVSSDAEECLPVWPHADHAAEWANGDWSDCTPAAIQLDVWLKRWIPGMEQDGTLIAVFPNDNEEGVVVTPTELLESIELELSKH